MTLSTPRSFFDTLTQRESSPEAVSVSPTTLKGLVGSWVDSLVEQSCSALVWAKFPRGEAWQADLLKCSALLPDDRQVYSLVSAADEGVDATAIASSLEGNTLLASVDRQPIQFQLGLENSLRREFFFMVVSKEFCGLIVAQRVKVKRLTALEAAEVVEGGDRRNMLMVSCGVGWSQVQPMLEQLETLLETQVEEVSEDTTVASCVEKWRSQLEKWDLSMAEPERDTDFLMLSSLINRQMHRQEDLWQRMMTHRKQSESVDLLQMQNAELMQSVRAKDEFLSNVGQELRTPLTNMKTALTLLNSPNIKPPQRQRYMDLLIRECDRQTSLIGSLLDLVSLDQMAERETLQAISLSDVVPGVVSTYQPLAEEKGVRLAHTIPDDLPPIACLVPWLRQIVVGLIHNGIKFTPTGGQVWVRAKQQGDFLQLEFKDTGIGISVQEIPKIFDRFYRVRQVSGEESSGAGLGLTIVQQLLLRSGGSISVKSRPGDGSIFSVMLPIYQYRD